MGQPQSEEANAKVMEELAAELAERLATGEGKLREYWRSFGFNLKEGWREDGFTVIAEEAYVMALARRFRQGAIFQFQRLPGGAAFRRNTVPVCLPNTDAAVSVAVCERPLDAGAYADPHSWGDRHGKP
ncbi:unnamed protein product [Symbiodinium pilosum]|uniref:Uncharacterized protein n=1 Tax=Symbiodinium pilosum TaxID=2952 RepID=A0A812JGS4_SYMPI|nr:unnamed protein product [Symbiodinium pilosum]